RVRGVATLGYRGYLTMLRIFHLEVLVGETSGPVKLEEMRRFVLGDDLECIMAASEISVKVVLPVLCKCVKMEKPILIIFGSPVLKTLVLCSCNGFEELNIINDSVKNFVISGYSSEMDTLQINAPYIESLTIKGDFDLRAILLLNMSSFIQARLDYSNTKALYAMEIHKHHQMNEELFKGLILSISHFKELKFGKSCLESEGQWIMTLQTD
nr:F-box protein At5g03100-like [Tanacetum cinerariifolium]